MRAPLEVKVTALLILLGAAIFVIVAFALNNGSLRFPTVTGIVAVAACVVLLVRLPFARAVTMTVVTLLALVHLLIVLDSGPWWVRAISGLLTAVYIYAAVLVNTEPAQQYLEH